MAIPDRAGPVPGHHRAAGILRGRIYRRPRRLLNAVLPVAVVFLAWDAVAIAAGVWKYNGDYITGIELPFRVPMEEALFFVVIPVCALLTYNAVTTILDRRRRR